MGVLVGHYVGLIKYASAIDVPRWLINFVNEFPLIFNEAFWLQLFFIASGYLLAKTKIDSIKGLFVKCIRRFFRLAFPIFFSYCVIYSLGIAVGFHNSQTNVIFSNSWFQGAFSEQYGIDTVLLAPIDVLIFGNTKLNSPYWVLRHMFFASILIYVFNYARGVLLKGEQNLFLDVFVVFFALFMPVPQVISVCLLGMEVYNMGVPVMIWVRKSINNLKLFEIVILCVVLVITALNPQMVTYVVLFSFIILVGIDFKFLQNKLFVFLGNISFGIFSFHWPIICSIGASYLLWMTSWTSLAISLMITYVICLLLTILMSLINYNTFEKLSNQYTEKITDWLCCVRSKVSA